jgi:hypothetical protein
MPHPLVVKSKGACKDNIVGAPSIDSCDGNKDACLCSKGSRACIAFWDNQVVAFGF